MKTLLAFIYGLSMIGVYACYLDGRWNGRLAPCFLLSLIAIDWAWAKASEKWDKLRALRRGGRIGG